MRCDRRDVRGGALALSAALLLSSCGQSPTQPTTPTPTTRPTAAATETPAAASTCKHGDFPPGPVVKYAIAPRGVFRLPGQEFVLPMKVHIRKPYDDEVWCVNKDQKFRLEFGSTQRNADGKVCCWTDPRPQWWIAEDPMAVVSNYGPYGNDFFNFRLHVDARGLHTYVSVQASLDHVGSTAWQATSFYGQHPVRIEFMSSKEIQQTCECDYYGNAIYAGHGCSKVH